MISDLNGQGYLTTGKVVVVVVRERGTHDEVLQTNVVSSIIEDQLSDDLQLVLVILGVGELSLNIYGGEAVASDVPYHLNVFVDVGLAHEVRNVLVEVVLVP